MLFSLHVVFSYMFLGSLCFVWWSFDFKESSQRARQELLFKAVKYYITLLILIHVSGFYLLFNGYEISRMKIFFVILLDAMFLHALSFHKIFNKLPPKARQIRKIMISLILLIFIVVKNGF